MNARMKAMSGTMLKALSATQQDALVEMWEVDFRAFGGKFSVSAIRLTN